MGYIFSGMGYILAKTETTYGTDSTPTVANNAIIVSSMSPPESNFSEVIRTRVKATVDGDAHCVIPNRINYSFEVPVGPVEDADGGTPSINPLLLAGGLAVATGGTAAGGDLTADYTEVSAAYDSCTIWFAVKEESSGQIGYLKATGCRHKITFRLSLNSEVIMTVAGTGLYNTWATFTGATLPTTYGHGLAQFCANGLTASFASTSESCSELVFDPGFEVGVIEEITGSNNVKEVILNRTARPTLQWNPLADSSQFSGSTLQARARNGTEGALSVTFTDATSSQSFTISSAAAQMGFPNMTQQDGFMRWDQTIHCNGNGSGNDSFTIAWAEV